MRFSRSLPILLALMVVFAADSAFAGRRVRTFGHKETDSNSDTKKSKGKDDLKPYKKLIKDKVVVEGLFTFYQDTVDNSVLMSIKADQIGPIYLCNMGRSTADGTFYDVGRPGRSFPFYFKRVGKSLLFMEKNLRVRADTSTRMYGAVSHGISDHLYASVSIKSKPQDSTNAILIDAGPLFIRDDENTGYQLGKQAKTGFSFDKKNSYFESVKSFPENSELSVMLHFKSSKPNYGASLQNGQSFYHTYHYSLSSIPETDYVPRLADPRVGYFVTMYHDYSRLDTESPYVRYIERWDLQKKNPDARVSEPVKPIVFWIENTVPDEYRDPIAEGIEFWNQSFAKLGYRNAVIAEQMPDDADWDPLDVRYSTIRWMVTPRVYAIGPSRANPFTGQIYDADISMSANFIRIMFNNMENFIRPVSFDGTILDEPDQMDFARPEQFDDRICTYGDDLAQEAAFGLAYVLSAAGDLADKDTLTKEYVHAYLTEVIAHEVGHTLGFRHNFKASTIHTLEELRDREFTRRNSTVGTVMEYAPPNIAAKGQTQGEFFASTPGAYDDWVVEYGYTDFGAENPMDEFEQLQAIAARSSEPDLVYATDQDRWTYRVDPLANAFDLGDDPIKYCQHKINLTRELWHNSIKEFEKPGTSYEKIRRVFRTGWRSYIESARIAARYVGGLYHNKDFVGNTAGNIPFTPVPASEQRRAVNFLTDQIFAAGAFDLDPDLLNKLQSVQSSDFSSSVYRTPLAYPWHQSILNVQQNALRILYNPLTLGRLLNNVDRYKNKDEVYSMQNMFTDIRRSIWGEIVGPSNVSSKRRQLQLAHLTQVSAIYLSSVRKYPTDARTLAANDLEILLTAANNAVNSTTIDEMTKAHYREVIRQVEATKEARRLYRG